VAALVTCILLVVAVLLHNKDPVKSDAVRSELPSQLLVTFTVGAFGIALIVTVTAVLGELSHPVLLSLDTAYAVYVPAFVPAGATVTLPPVEAVYHTTADPEGAVALPE